ncbi:MAG: glycosyltransferase family 4 protein [Akkermansiaceae bacterium]|nr:glycosyltransferase family 4 protein [Armatimonadota bacterium]
MVNSNIVARKGDSLRIALLHADLPNESKGGVAHQTHHLANSFVERGHSVTVITFSPSFDECLYAVETISRPNIPRAADSFGYAFALTRVDFSRFDIIHAMGDNYLIGSNNRPPLVRTMHGSAKDELRTAESLKRKLFQAVLVPLETLGAVRADYVTGISEATRARVPQVREIIANGVDLGRFTPAALTNKESAPTLLFVGTKTGRKRGQWLADMWSRDIKPFLPEGATLWSVADAPLEGDGIVNHGRVPLETLTNLFRRAWAFCLPSTYEGFGVPYIEAFASGTAVIASPNPGAVEVTQNGKFGIVAQDDRIAGEIVSVLTDASRRDALVQAGLRRVTEYDWQRISAQYEEIFHSLIGARKH